MIWATGGKSIQPDRPGYIRNGPYRAAIETANDKYRVTAPVGKFKPNPWGLYDMHGNVAEWTRSIFTPGSKQMTVRGGSFSDVPKRATCSFRLGYYPWQKVYNVGFRVVIEDTPTRPLQNKSNPLYRPR